MKESEIERRMERAITKMGGLCWKFTSPGTIGVPDRIVILPNGHVTFVELKTAIGRLANIQKYRIEQLQEHNVDARIIRGVESMQAFVDECKERLK